MFSLQRQIDNLKMLNKYHHERTVFILLFLLCAAQSQSLIKVNFSDIISTGNNIYSSGIGLTYDFPTLIPHLTDLVLIGYLNNAAIYNNSDYLFWQTIHCPIGYKYNCSSTLFGGASINCTVDISANSTLYGNLNSFFYLTGQYWASNMGWDMEKANFSRTAYKTNMANYYYSLWGNWVNVQLIDKGDTLTNYTASQLTSDASKIASATYYTSYILAPGLTESNTNDAWWNSIPTFSSYMGIFTLRCVIFKNIADTTISNLMSDTYVDGYITKRLTQPNGYYNNPIDYQIAFSDIRLTGTTGVNGVTNSFAAALWAFDFSLKFMSIGGHSASFYTPFTSSNQSVLGSSPDFGPQALYYGLLFANYAISKYPKFVTPNVTAVGSQFIKVYAVQFYQGQRLILINKDLNKSSNGTVDVSLNYDGLLDCNYMQADDLSSTDGITIGNVSFVSKSSDFVGLWNTLKISGDESGIFQIPIRYAQAVICTTIPKAQYKYFPRKSSLANYQAHLYLTLLLLAILAL